MMLDRRRLFFPTGGRFKGGAVLELLLLLFIHRSIDSPMNHYFVRSTFILFEEASVTITVTLVCMGIDTFVAMKLYLDQHSCEEKFVTVTLCL